MVANISTPISLPVDTLFNEKISFEQPRWLKRTFKEFVPTICVS